MPKNCELTWGGGRYCDKIIIENYGDFFMRLEKFKRTDKKQIGILVLIGICILLVAGVFFYTSFATFQVQQEFNIIKGTVQDLGDVYFAYYVDNELVSEIPLQNSGYVFDEEKSNCTNDAHVTWNYDEWFPEVRNLTETRTKCTLYFKKTKIVDTVLGEIEVYGYTPDFTKSACDDETCGSHEKGIFETTDADGTTYYYRGSVENNYVYFANRYWRIIRINGDGTIRMIYDGTVAHDNGEVSEDRQAATSPFNSANNDNMYAGYMYTSGDADGIGTSSAIKTAVDNFYTSVLSLYSRYIDTNAGFCGDRSTLNLQDGVGTGTETTYNQGYLRVVESAPNLICANANDLYTASSSSQGNKALQYPVGLISVDEVLLAGVSGGVFDGSYNHQKRSLNSYLINGNTFWTMTPAGSYVAFGNKGWSSYIFRVNLNGYFDDDKVTVVYGVRPVINLRKDVTITGEGTKENPYQVS